MSRMICEIKKDWVKINPYAMAYLKPMLELCTVDDNVDDNYEYDNYAMAYLKPMLELCTVDDNVDDNYGYDNARSVRPHFLSNASGYRGGRSKELLRNFTVPFRYQMKLLRTFKELYSSFEVSLYKKALKVANKLF